MRTGIKAYNVPSEIALQSGRPNLVFGKLREYRLQKKIRWTRRTTETQAGTNQKRLPRGLNHKKQKQERAKSDAEAASFEDHGKV